VLKEILPDATILGVLLNPADPQLEVQSALLLKAARTLGIQIEALRANTTAELDAAFRRVVQQKLPGLAIGASALFNVHSEQLGALAVRYAVPTIFQTREFTGAGGLMSYGGNLADLYHLAGVYAGRILKGQSPADLPVQQATKIEMVVNLKAAKALGLTVPPTLLALADEIIE
jgi:putative ABC transport system substrate-binding protein